MDNLKQKGPFKLQRLQRFEYKGNYLYSLTLCTHGGKSYFDSAEFTNFIKESLVENAEKFRFDVLCYCFMPDHLHVLADGKDLSSNLLEFIKMFKQKTGFAFTKITGKKLWQKSYYDHILRNEEDINKMCRYILENPVRKGLVEDYSDYPFSWCKFPMKV